MQLGTASSLHGVSTAGMSETTQHGPCEKFGLQGNCEVDELDDYCLLKNPKRIKNHHPYIDLNEEEYFSGFLSN